MSRTQTYPSFHQRLLCDFGSERERLVDEGHEAPSDAYDLANNMIDDGQHYEYVYDPFGRLRKVFVRDTDPLLTVLVAEYRYNGLNQRITAHFDTNTDTVVDGDDMVSHFAYDARWRIVARYEDANSDPTEQFDFHNAGLASTGTGSYIDAVMLRDRDTTANGTLDERVYYLHNWRSDIVALISHAGSQIEQVRYEPYGTPFGIPAGDITYDGEVTQADANLAGTWPTTHCGWCHEPAWTVVRLGTKAHRPLKAVVGGTGGMHQGLRSVPPARPLIAVGAMSLPGRWFGWKRTKAHRPLRAVVGGTGGIHQGLRLGPSAPDRGHAEP